MHHYYLRHLLDSLLDSERHKALASVLPHPHLEAFNNPENGSSADQSQSDATSTTSSELAGATASADNPWSPSQARPSCPSTAAVLSPSATPSASAVVDIPTSPFLQRTACVRLHQLPGADQHACKEDKQHPSASTLPAPALAEASAGNIQLPNDDRPCKRHKTSSHAEVLDSNEAQLDTGQSPVSAIACAVQRTANAGEPTNDEDSVLADSDRPRDSQALHLAAMRLIASAVADSLTRMADAQLSSGKLLMYLCLLNMYKLAQFSAIQFTVSQLPIMATGHHLTCSF